VAGEREGEGVPVEVVGIANDELADRCEVAHSTGSDSWRRSGSRRARSGWLRRRLGCRGSSWPRGCPGPSRSAGAPGRGHGEPVGVHVVGAKDVAGALAAVVGA
jgi:hypothetical protein